jgi:CxxC motif-containing protein (DUF1111 family)
VDAKAAKNPGVRADGPGLGPRIFFLHDGRATFSNDGLLTAIQEHAGSASEANAEINLFQQLNSQQQQDLLNFLRSL